MRKQAIVNARVPNLKPFHVECAVCGLTMRESTKPPLFAVDHIIAASDPAASILDWNDYFDRLFAPTDAHQVLCHECHDEKTKTENASRLRPNRKKKRTRKVRGKRNV